MLKNDKCDYCSETFRFDLGKIRKVCRQFGVYVGMYVCRYIRKVCSYDGLDVMYVCRQACRYVGKQVCRYIDMYVGRYVIEHG